MKALERPSWLLIAIALIAIPGLPAAIYLLMAGWNNASQNNIKAIFEIYGVLCIAGIGIGVYQAFVESAAEGGKKIASVLLGVSIVCSAGWLAMFSLGSLWESFSRLSGREKIATCAAFAHLCFLIYFHQKQRGLSINQP